MDGLINKYGVDSQLCIAFLGDDQNSTTALEFDEYRFSSHSVSAERVCRYTKYLVNDRP